MTPETGRDASGVVLEQPTLQTSSREVAPSGRESTVGCSELWFESTSLTEVGNDEGRFNSGTCRRVDNKGADAGLRDRPAVFDERRGVDRIRGSYGSGHASRIEWQRRNRKLADVQTVPDVIARAGKAAWSCPGGGRCSDAAPYAGSEFTASRVIRSPLIKDVRRD